MNSSFITSKPALSLDKQFFISNVNEANQISIDLYLDSK